MAKSVIPGTIRQFVLFKQRRNALAVKSVGVGPCCHDVDKALLVDAASDNTAHVTPFAIVREEMVEFLVFIAKEHEMRVWPQLASSCHRLRTGTGTSFSEALKLFIAIDS
jgi:hypothetical protein